MTTKKIEPVSYWRKWWKLHSTWLNLAGIGILTFLELAPQKAIEAWVVLPQEFKSEIPHDYLKYVALVLWVMAFFARFIKQKKLDKEVSDGKQD